MIRRISLFVYVIIHCDVLIIIRLLVFIIGKICSRLSRVDGKINQAEKEKVHRKCYLESYAASNSRNFSARIL